MVTAVWGWTFVLVKDAVTHYPTLPFLQLRFILAFLVMVVLVPLVWGLLRRGLGLPMFGAPTIAELEGERPQRSRLPRK